MDAKRLAEIKERAAKATEGPWASAPVQPLAAKEPVGWAVCRGYDWIADGPCSRQPDADFIAHARTDVPDLIAALEAAQARVAQLESVVEAALEKP